MYALANLVLLLHHAHSEHESYVLIRPPFIYLPQARHPLIKRKQPRHIPELPEPDYFEEGMPGEGDDTSIISDDTDATSGSFLSSLNLNVMKLGNFIDDPGNFLYLRQKHGTSGVAYDLEVVDHSKIVGESRWATSKPPTV